MVLDTFLLNTQQYKVRIKDKVEQTREGAAPSPTPRSSSYWKESLLAAHDCGRQLLFIWSFNCLLTIIISNLKTYYSVQIIYINNSYLKL